MDQLRRYITGKTPAPNDRDDILQERVVRVLARANTGSLPAAELGPYAFRVAANLINDGYRRGKRTLVEMPLDMASETPSPERIFEAREELSAVSSRQKLRQGWPSSRSSKAAKIPTAHAPPLATDQPSTTKGLNRKHWNPLARTHPRNRRQFRRTLPLVLGQTFSFFDALHKAHRAVPLEKYP